MILQVTADEGFALRNILESNSVLNEAATDDEVERKTLLALH
jgi:hypothetical protein